MLTVSVYLHGLCSHYPSAPRCVPPRVYDLALPRLAHERDADGLASYADELRARVERWRRELIALSTSDATLPSGVTPPRLFLEKYPIVRDGAYAQVSGSDLDAARIRGWIVLRRHMSEP